LSADIQSNPISVRVTYDSMSSSERTWDLTVPASGIVTLTVPTDAARNFISMTVKLYSDTGLPWCILGFVMGVQVAMHQN